MCADVRHTPLQATSTHAATGDAHIEQKIARLETGGVAVGAIYANAGSVVNIGGQHYHTHVETTRASYLYAGVPPMVRVFVGREMLVGELVGELAGGAHPRLAVHGLPGVGKTTLAVALAHHGQVLEHFDGGVLWGSLGPVPNIAVIQDMWARALGVGVDMQGLALEDQRTALLTSAVAVLGKPVLVVLDDVWQVAAANALTLGAGNVVHLLTTRDWSLAQDYVKPVKARIIPELERAPSYTLLQTLAPEAWNSDPQAATHLADRMGGLPLALELVGGYLAAPERTLFPDLTEEAFVELADPMRRLTLATQRLGAASGAQQTLGEAIRLSVDELATTHAPAAAVFYALGAFAPKPARFERAAAEAVTLADGRTLALLATRSLVEAEKSGSFALHQVLADFARTQTPTEAVERHVQYYLDLVNEDPEDWQRVEAVYAQVRFAWQRLAECDDPSPLLIDFVLRLSAFQERRGIWQDKLAWCERAFAYAQAESLDSEQASMLVYIGRVRDALGTKRQALAYYEQALPLFRQIGNKGGEATTLNNIATVYFALGAKHQALEYFIKVLPLRRQVDDKGGEAVTLNNIGLVYSALGNMRQALGYYVQALPLQRRLGDKGGEATTLNNIGLVYFTLGDKHQALDDYQQALPLFRLIGDKGGEATTLNNIGRVYDDLGDKRQALDFYEQSLPLQRQVGDEGGEATTLNNIGMVHSALGDKRQALDYLGQALLLERKVDDKGGEATTLNNIGRVHYALDDKRQALDYFEQALPLRRLAGDQWGESTTCFNIAMCHRALGDVHQTAHFLEQVVVLEKAIGHPDWANTRALLEQVRFEQSRQGRPRLSGTFVH